MRQSEYSLTRVEQSLGKIPGARMCLSSAFSSRSVLWQSRRARGLMRVEMAAKTTMKREGRWEQGLGTPLAVRCITTPVAVRISLLTVLLNL